MTRLMTQKLSTLLLLLFAVSATGFAQMNLPQKSPAASISYTVGLTKITINYSAPAVNERAIWGTDIVPYDKVWRAGANGATTMEFSTPITIEGKELAAGKYSFFMIPKASGDWTAIFNTVPDQWGAYDYDESKDALRVDFTPKSSKVSEERLSYTIVDQGMDKGYIRIGWEKKRMYLRFRVDYLDQAVKNVEEGVAAAPDDRKWVAYAQGADFLLGAEKMPEKALEWAQKSTEMFNHGWNNWILAQAKAMAGDYSGAVASAMKSKDATMANPSDDDNFYNDMAGVIEKKVAEWKTK